MVATDEKALGMVQDQLKEGAPVPTHDYILIEAFDKWIIVHACYGEVVNRTLERYLMLFSQTKSS
jgi:Lhr-like helicase